MGEFNAEEAKIHIKDEANIHNKDFCNLSKLKKLIKVPTRFKNLDNPKTTDIMLTNST